MCLILRKGNYTSSIIKRNTLCFKFGKIRVWSGEGIRYFYSDTRYFRYSKNELQKEVEFTFSDNSSRVEQGYHSIKYFYQALTWSLRTQLFLIPKGSIYYEGKLNYSDTVSFASNRIVWIGSAWNPLNYFKIFKHYNLTK